MSDSSEDEQPFNLRDYDEEDSEEEGFRPNKRRKTTSRTLRGRGLGFVKSTGAEEEQDEAEEDEDVDDERPSMGMGLGANAGLGMGGFRSAFNIGEYNEGEAEPETSPAQPDMSPRRQQEKVGGTGPSAFGAGGRLNKSSFAARMMAKQGYVEGQGLGKAGQGITAPIQATVLSSRAGLGQGSATREPPRRRQEGGKDKTSSKTSTPGASTPRLRAPPKAKYAVTAIEARGLHVPEAMKQIIVDATGAETKTLTSLSGFSTPTREASPSPGLEAAKATSRIKIQLQAFADAWDSTKDQEIRLEQEETQLSASLVLREEEIQKYNDIISAFERVTVDDSNTPRDWDASISRLQGIQTRFADNITDLSLPELTVSCLETPFRRELLDWDPLSEPNTKLVASLQSICPLLELEKSTAGKHRKRTTPFESLLLVHWFPIIRTALTKEWNIYDPDPAYTLLSTWTPLLPPWLLSKLLSEIILPRLIEAVRRFPKTVEQPATAGNKKSRHAPDLHTFLFDWWTLLSSETLQLDAFPELRSLVKQKVTSEVWEHWKPLLGSRRQKAAPQTSVPAAAPVPSISKAGADMDEISFKSIVENWASEHNLLFTTSHKSDAFGRLLYRLQDAERRNRGVLVYLAEDIVFGAEDGDPYALDDRLVGMARAR
ncbi:hypothetical protein H2200_010167 [Cladophialophora chaetospira]|uniref:G-patch domain-containing protein n=1 Tax=Cladophialophora chaetospira TaxID=386627 RepID=A0AA39CEH8_9EURO|nr:hypothetical protein H2200_010167 [Cladophialophora chaetospira]